MANSPLNVCDEIWKPVVGWLGYYEVSNFGRVRSVERKVSFCGRWGPSTRQLPMRILVLSLSNGYFGLTLRRPGVKIYRHVHTLVCEAFHGEKPSPMYQVAHKDGDRSNNVSHNLRWSTPIENNADKKVHGTYTQGDRHNRTKLPDKEVERLRGPNGAELIEKLAEEYRMQKHYLKAISLGKVR